MKQELDPPTFEDLLESTKAYVEAHVELLKLKFVDKTSTVTSSLVSMIVITIFAFITIILVSAGIAIWLGKILGEYYYGFYIVAAFFMLLIGLLYIFREKWLKMPVANSMIEKMSK